MGANNAACCHLLCPHSFGSILGRKKPGKGGNISKNAFSDPYPYPERGIWPNKNKGGGPSPPPTQNFACSLLSSSPKQVWLSLYDVAVSWLRLQTPIDCIPHPYWVYSKCLGTLSCCGWAYGCILMLLYVWRWW